MAVAGAVGVVGERGLLRQRGQTGQQCRGSGAVDSRSSTWETRLVRVSFDASSDSSQLAAGYDTGAGIACLSDQVDQVGHQKQQRRPWPSPAGPARWRSPVWRSCVAGCRGPGWRPRCWQLRRVAQQPPEPLLGEDLPDAGAVSGVPSPASRAEIS